MTRHLVPMPRFQCLRRTDEGICAFALCLSGTQPNPQHRTDNGGNRSNGSGNPSCFTGESLRTGMSFLVVSTINFHLRKCGSHAFSFRAIGKGFCDFASKNFNGLFFQPLIEFQLAPHNLNTTPSVKYVKNIFLGQHSFLSLFTPSRWRLA